MKVVLSSLTHASIDPIPILCGFSLNLSDSRNYGSCVATGQDVPRLVFNGFVTNITLSLPPAFIYLFVCLGIEVHVGITL